MPPSRGMAPPLKPVPAPRPTMGTPCSRGDLDDGGNVVGVAREHHQLGAGLVDAAVVFVERQVFGAVEIAARAQQIDQFPLSRRAAGRGASSRYREAT